MANGWKQEYVGPDRSRGAKIKPKRERTHYSKSEVRMDAIEAEGEVAYSKGISWDDNPKISLGARSAWWKGWNKALNDATGESHV